MGALCLPDVERHRLQQFSILGVDTSCFLEFCSVYVGIRRMRVFCILRVRDAAYGRPVTEV